MNLAEFNQLSQRIFIAFPMVFKQLKENSPDVKGTLKNWLRVLKDTSLEDADSIVDSWLDGLREPPKMYECDLVPFMIRDAILKSKPRKASEDPYYAGYLKL